MHKPAAGLLFFPPFSIMLFSMDIKLIATDLDCTLLDARKQLSEGNKEALLLAGERGIEFVPATGRLFATIPEDVKALPCMHYAIVINGAQVRETATGHVIYDALIPLKTALEIFRFLDDKPVVYDCYFRDSAYMTASMYEKARDYFADDLNYEVLRRSRRPVPELKAMLAAEDSPLQKLQLFTADTALKASLLAELQRRWPALSIVTSTPTNIEMTSGDATKGKALEKLAEHLSLRKEEVMAFGDDVNDVSMLEAAGLGIAMENAKPEVLKNAGFVTLHHDKDGVAYGIRRFCGL